MGGRSYRCPHCGKDHFAWHSCNHRLCPICGSADTREWVSGQLENRLPVEYFMVTFTLPSELRAPCKRLARAFLRLFFAASSQAIKDVLKNPKHLGGGCGFIGVLQTWTQDLRYHPHIHYIIPAVALGDDGKIKRPKKAGWLARGDVFAARMKTLLLKSIAAEELLLQNDIKPLWNLGFNCDVEPFGDGANAFKYLGRYLCKGPISDSRIRSSDERSTTISVKNRSTERTEIVTMDTAEFIRRYLQHALPDGFHAIRYYGFLHSRAAAKLQTIRKQLGIKAEAKSDKEESPAPEKTLPLCPHCRKPMELVDQLSRAPPWERTIPKIWERRQQIAA